MNGLAIFITMFCLLGCGEIQSQTEEITQDVETPRPETETEIEVEEPVIERGPCQSEELLASWPEAAATPMVASALNNLSGVSRDRRVLQEIVDGHSGDLEGAVSPVVVISGGNEILYCVFNDYLALFENDKKFRFPLGMTAIESFVQNSEWSLPTRKMVNQIYQQADIKLAPRPIPPSSAMSSTPVILDHSDIVNDQLGTETGLIGGHKKDVVISARLQSRPSKIAIYGWHRLNGNAIQPLSTVHHKDYGDYSQGIRLIYKTVWVNGNPMALADVMRDSSLGLLLSDEGVLSSTLVNKYYR